MKILLTSVFGPYGVDDQFGRKENIMELFHNQITREQDIFSLRFHHPSFGLHMLALNINTPTVVLDFPSIERFVKEISSNSYDYIGITFITPNFVKAKHMCELIRQHSPGSKIILGGQGSRIPNIEELIDHDYICKGEGIKWLRELLGEDLDRPFKHPVIPSAFSKRVMGVPLKSDTAVVIPGVGCPNGCRFCCTSHFYDRKYTPYFDTGQDLFNICRDIEERLGFTDFFVMDENFLKRYDRALELVQLMEKNKKPYRFGIFSSAETITEVGVEFMVRLGVFTVWMGVESKHEIYEKNRGIDFKKLVKNLRDHGINTLASGILFLEHHDPESIQDDINFMVDLEPDFIQFMQLGPLPETPLFKEYREKNLIRKDVPFEEWHGQHRIWYHHPHFTPEQSENILRDAFKQDYDRNGSSLLRMCDTAMRGFRMLTDDSSPLLRMRRESFLELTKSLRPSLCVLKKYAHNQRVKDITTRVINDYEETLGPATLKDKLLGQTALTCARLEKYRLKSGRTIRQPKTMRTMYHIE